MGLSLCRRGGCRTGACRTRIGRKAIRWPFLLSNEGPPSLLRKSIVIGL
jgi:hypothetical protein